MIRLPFYAAAVSRSPTWPALVILPIAAIVRSTPLSLRSRNPIGALAAVLRRPVLGRLAWARLFADVARMTSQVIWTFSSTVRFGWSTAQVGAVMAAGALAGVVFGPAVGPLVRRLGDKRAAYSALTMDLAHRTA